MHVALHSRPAAAADLPEITSLAQSSETHWFGAVESDEAEVRESFERVDPLAERSRLVLDGDRLVAAVWWWQPDEVSLHVDPTADVTSVYDDVLPWLASSGATRGEALSRDDVLRAAFVRHGWTHVLSQFELSRDTAPLPTPGWPDDVTTTAMDDHADDVYRVIYDEAGWAEVPGHSQRDREEWRSIFVAGHDPEQQVLAWHDGRLVGVALGKTFSDGTGWIAQLAVPSDQQGRGLGTALLTEAFGRRIAGGAVRLGLGVSAANPDALRMYLKLGLEIDREWMAYRRLA
jgi:GNAT superfamily N-acetyltransferase